MGEARGRVGTMAWVLGAVAVVGAGCGEPTHGLVALTFEVEITEGIDFGHAWVGSATAGQLDIRSTGTGGIEVLGLVADRDVDLPAGSDGFVVGGGQTVSVSVVWRPSTAGSYRGRVRVIFLAGNRNAPRERAVQVTGFADGIPVCEGGEPSCDDGNPCTDDIFDLGTESWVHIAVPRLCDDGNACTELDQCDAGSCVGVAVACDDQTACTADQCDAATGCIYPPIPATCDDGDPCTVDLCESGAGCSFSTAPDQTICGPVDCATLSVCILGNCVTLDIRGASEGLPCNDGNACTEPDTCHNGECNPGVDTRPQPGIIASFETFGGGGSFVATGGSTYLFADPRSARLQVIRDEATGLVRHQTLPFADPLPPLASGANRFLVASQVGVLGALDTTQPDATVWLWQTGFVDPSPPSVGYDDVTIDVDHLAPVTGGVVYAARFVYRQGGVLVGKSGGIYFAATPDVTVVPGAAVTVHAESDPIVALATDGPALVFGAAGRLRWRLLDASGAVIESADRPWRGGPVAVAGRRVGWVDVDGIAVDEVVAGAGFRPFASFTFFAGATGLALDSDWLFVGRDRMPIGVFALPLVAGAGQDVIPTLVDPMSTEGLVLSNDHLLLAGDIALPLRRSAPGSADFGRVTGDWHGDITTFADDVDGIVLVGPVAQGTVTVAPVGPPVLTQWTLRRTSARAAAPFVVRGVRDDALVRTALVGEALPWAAGCTGTVIESLAVDGTTGLRVGCGLLQGSICEAAGGRLWAYVPIGPDPAAWSLRAWPLDAGPPVWPTLDAGDLAGPGGGPVPVGLRAVSGGDTLALLVPAAPPSVAHQITVQLYPAAAGSLAPPRGIVVACGASCAGGTEPLAVDADGDLILHGVPGGVALSQAAQPPAAVSPMSTMLLPDLIAGGRVHVGAMGAGRAWIAWSSATAAQLRQVHYDTGTLESPGEVALPAAPAAVFDAGALVAAATVTGVVLIAPACF